MTFDCGDFGRPFWNLTTGMPAITDVKLAGHSGTFPDVFGSSALAALAAIVSINPRYIAQTTVSNIPNTPDFNFCESGISDVEIRLDYLEDENTVVKIPYSREDKEWFDIFDHVQPIWPGFVARALKERMTDGNTTITEIFSTLLVTDPGRDPMNWINAVTSNYTAEDLGNLGSSGATAMYDMINAAREQGRPIVITFAEVPETWMTPDIQVHLPYALTDMVGGGDALRPQIYNIATGGFEFPNLATEALVDFVEDLVIGPANSTWAFPSTDKDS